MILVDSSAWIQLHRGQRRERFNELAPAAEIVTCLPVVQEVLQGLDDEIAYSIARAAFDDMPVIEDPLTRATFDDAIELYRSARRYGVTVRSSVDCLIAACAIRNGATLLHSDRDFENLSRVSSALVTLAL